jgi:hypothetical protein
MLRYVRFIALAPAFFAGACAGATDPFGPTFAEISVLEGVEYRAEVRLEANSRNAVGPALVMPVVRLTNLTSEPLQIDLDGCPVVLRVHRDAERSRSPAWSSDRPGVQCMQAPYSITLAPGRSEEVSSAYDGGLLLSQLGEPGRYYFTIDLRTLPDARVLPAGHADLTFGADQLGFSGDTELEGMAPQELVSSVAVTNRGRRTVRLEYGACSMHLQLFDSPERAGNPVWDSTRRPNPDPETGHYWACPMYLRVTELAPGRSHTPGEFTMRIPVPQILGDSIPDGRYYVTARVSLNGFTRSAPAGEVDLVARQEPLPSERWVGDLAFRAETIVESGPGRHLRTRITVTNHGTRAVEIPMARNVVCPIQLSGFRNFAARENAYRWGSPDWVVPGCPLVIPRASLAPGESRVFEGRYEVPERVAAAGSGSLYMLALLWMEGIGGGRVFLAAGEALLPR